MRFDASPGRRRHRRTHPIFQPVKQPGVQARSHGAWRPGDAAASALDNDEGAGNAGRRPRPWPACEQKCRRQVPQVQPNIRHSLRGSFNAYTRSPRCTGLVGHRGDDARHARHRGTPASGCQDHATSRPQAHHSSAPLRCADALTSTALPAQRLVTTRTPLIRTGTRAAYAWNADFRKIFISPRSS